MRLTQTLSFTESFLDSRQTLISYLITKPGSVCSNLDSVFFNRGIKRGSFWLIRPELRRPHDLFLPLEPTQASCTLILSPLIKYLLNFTLIRIIRISPNPLSAIFGISPDADLPVALERALAFTSLLARRLILLNMKLPSPPTHDRWVKEVLDNLRLEKLRSSLKSATSKFLGTWNPFLGLVDSLNLSPDLEVRIPTFFIIFF